MVQNIPMQNNEPFEGVIVWPGWSHIPSTGQVAHMRSRPRGATATNKKRRDLAPRHCSITAVLSFLQEWLKKGTAFSTFKVYLVAISACHVGLGETTIGADPLVCRFIKGSLRPVSKPLAPSWALALVQDAIICDHFEPLETVALKTLVL